MKRSAIQWYFAELSFDGATEKCASKTAAAKKSPRKKEDYCGKGRKEDVLKARWMPSMSAEQ